MIADILWNRHLLCFFSGLTKRPRNRNSYGRGRNKKLRVTVTKENVWTGMENLQ